MLGADHPDTLSSRNNLAAAYQEAGRPAEAIPLFEQTLADCERVLGADHPDTLTSRNNLAAAYQAAGRLGEAIPLYEQTLADRERVLGADHPDTLTSRNNLAGAYQVGGAAGRGDPAATSRPSPTGAGARRRPPRHPERRGTTSRTPTRRRGGWARRSRCSSRPSPTRERVLGADHPNTLALAEQPRATPTRRRGGWPRRSRCTSRPSPTCERVLGADHPDTLTVRKNLTAAIGRGTPGAENRRTGKRRWLRR